MAADPLYPHVRRLIIVTTGLIALKLFTYSFTVFLPVFAEVVGKLFTAFLPFVLALVIAFLLEPIVLRLMKGLGLRRTYASLLALVLTAAFLTAIVFIVVARLYNELSELAVTLPNYGHYLNFVTRQIDALEKYITLNPQIQNTLFVSTESLFKTVQSWAKTASNYLLSFLTALPGVFIVLVVSVVATLLTSSSYPAVKRFITSLFPKRWHLSAQAIAKDLGAAVTGFLRAEAILVTVTSVMTMVGLLILGNRYAVTLGVLAGLLDVLPIVGTGMLFLPWIVGLFIMGFIREGFKLLVVWIITVVVRQFLEPKIMSRHIGLHPLPTLISMYVGLKLLGASGLVLGPALVIVYEALRKAGIIGTPKY